MPRKQIKTIDDLALMVGRGFNSVDKQFGAMGKKMDRGFFEINQHLGRIEQEILEDHRNRI